MSIKDILKSITAKAEEAKDKDKKKEDDKAADKKKADGEGGGGAPGDDDEKDKPKPPPMMDEEEEKEGAGGLKKIAEQILNAATKVDEGGAGPDTETANELRGLTLQLASALSSFKSEKPTTMTDMTPEQFKTHAEKEIEEATEKSDADRLELLAENVKSVSKQAEFFPRIGLLKVAVFRDPGQVKTTEKEKDPKSQDTGDGKLMGAFAKSIETLTDVVKDLKKEISGEGDDKDEKDKKKPDDKDKDKSEKGDVDWPLDLNKLRKEKSDTEKWGRTEKRDDDARDFGADPKECRG